MSKNKIEKRVVNIPKEQFDVLKTYCEENSLDMTKWIVKNSLEKINDHFPFEKRVVITRIKEKLANCVSSDSIIKVLFEPVNEDTKNKIESILGNVMAKFVKIGNIETYKVVIDDFDENICYGNVWFQFCKNEEFIILDFNISFNGNVISNISKNSQQ